MTNEEANAKAREWLKEIAALAAALHTDAREGAEDKLRPTLDKLDALIKGPSVEVEGPPLPASARTVVITDDVIDALDHLERVTLDHASTDVDAAVRIAAIRAAACWRQRPIIGRAPTITAELMEALELLAIAPRCVMPTALGHAIDAVLEAGKPAIEMAQRLRTFVGAPVTVTKVDRSEAKLHNGDTLPLNHQIPREPSREMFRSTATIERSADGAPCAIVLGPQLSAEGQATYDELRAKHAPKSDPPKTWRTTAELLGEHYRVTLRRGIAGQRALIGSVVFAREDVDALRADLAGVARTLAGAAVQALTRTLVDRLPPGMLVKELLSLQDTAAVSVEAKLERLLAQTFNVTREP